MRHQSQPLSPFGQQLRFWRRNSALSQLALAEMARTTPRHISFIETGRSRPGREVILRIAECLKLPIRATNELLIAAGLNPEFAERTLDDEALLPIRSAIVALLASHEPYPACAIDARGRIHLANESYLKLVPNALAMSAEESIDAFYGADGRESIENWPEVLWSSYDSRSDFARRSGDPELIKLAGRAFEHLKDTPRPTHVNSLAPVIFTRFRTGGEIISTFASAMRFDTAREITTSELRIELIFPADNRSAEIMRDLTSATGTPTDG